MVRTRLLILSCLAGLTACASVPETTDASTGAPSGGFLQIPYVPGRLHTDDRERTPVILPSAAETVLASIRARDVSWRVTGITGGADRLRVGLCAGDDDTSCRDILLTHPGGGCAGLTVGCWCLEGLADGDLGGFPGLADALGDIPATRAWGMGAAAPPMPSGTGLAASDGAGPGSEGPGRWLSERGPPPAPWRSEGIVASGRGEGADLAICLGPGDDAPRFGVGWAGEGGDCLLRTRSLCLYEKAVSGGVAVATRPAVEALGAWLQSLDRPCLMPQYRLAGVLRALFAAGALLLLGGWAWGAVRVLRRCRHPLSTALHLSVLFAVSAGLRWGLSPWNFVQEFFHTGEHLAALQCGALSPYGEAGPAIASALHALTGAGADAIFGTHWFMASLTPLAVAWLVRELTGRRVAGLAAGWVVCMLPQHLRFSASEVMFVPALFFMTTGLAALARHLRTREVGVATLGVLALLLATQTRPETMLALVLLPILAPDGPDARAGWRSPGVWTAVLVVGGMLAIARLLSPVDLDFARQALPWQRYLRWVWFDPAVTSPWLLIPWGAGVAVAVCRRHRAPVAWMLAGAALFTLSSLHFHDNDVFRQRSQLLAVPFHAALVAQGLGWGFDRLRALGVPVVVAVALCLAVPAATAVGRRGQVTRVTPAMAEWDFLDRTIPLLPDGAGARLFVATRGAGTFPVERLWLAGKRFVVRDLQDIDPTSRLPDAPRLYYQGMNCFVTDPESALPEAGMTAVCDGIRRRWELAPLHTLEITAEGGADVAFLPSPSGPFPVGFYEVVGPGRGR